MKDYHPPKKSPWYFPGPTSGRPWNPDNFSEILRIINLAMGNCEVTTGEKGKTRLRAWGSLDYRHTFGSHLAMRGESLYKIATLMGNSPEIARRHYAELLPESMRDSVEFDEPQSEQSGQIIRFQDYLAG